MLDAIHNGATQAKLLRQVYVFLLTYSSKAFYILQAEFEHAIHQKYFTLQQ